MTKTWDFYILLLNMLLVFLTFVLYVFFYAGIHVHGILSIGCCWVTMTEINELYNLVIYRLSRWDLHQTRPSQSISSSTMRITSSSWSLCLGTRIGPTLTRWDLWFILEQSCLNVPCRSTWPNKTDNQDVVICSRRKKVVRVVIQTFAFWYASS